MRSAKVLMFGTWVGEVIEEERHYVFKYRPEYLRDEKARPVSVTLPLRPEPYTSPILFSFFDGLIPEGWVLSLAERNWKVNERDRMGLLLVCCRDPIGAVSIEPLNSDHNES